MHCSRRYGTLNPKPEYSCIRNRVANMGFITEKLFCLACQMEQSISRRGKCWYNAVAKYFFSNLKKERIRKRIYRAGDSPGRCIRLD